MSDWSNAYDEPGEDESRKQLLINQLLEEKRARDDANSRPLEYLMEDIICQRLKVSFISALPTAVYKDAKEHAMACLISCGYSFRNMHPKQIGNCIQSIVHAFNSIFRFYVSEILMEEPIDPVEAQKKYALKDGYGADRIYFYHLQLEHRHIPYRLDMGAGLNALYDVLNDTKHLLKRKDGKVNVVRPKYSRLVTNSTASASKAMVATENAFFCEDEECRM